MGRINTYQRKQLASRAVGVAPADRSGQIVGAAVTKFGNTVIQEAQKMDMYSEMQANTSVMEFGLAFQKLGNQTQREMAGNPDGYETKILDGGQELVTAFADGIEDPIVRGKFLTSANTILRAGVAQAPMWAKKQKETNAKVAIVKGLQQAAISTGETLTKEAYMQNLYTFEEEILNKIPDEMFSYAEKEAFVRKEGPATLEAHFSNRILNSPEQLKADLMAGEYNKVPFYTAEMKTKFIGKAETKIRQQKTQLKEDQTANFYDLFDRQLAGQLSISEVRAARMAGNPNDSITAAQETRLISNLVTKIRLNAKNLKESQLVAERYVTLVEKSFDNLIDRAEVLDKLIDVYADGDISPEESKYLANMSANLRETLTAKKADGAMKSLEVIKNRALRIWGSDKKQLAIRTATYTQDMVMGMMAGAPANSIVRGILGAMDVEKVVSDNPALAAFEDPVGQSYSMRAETILEANGYPMDKANIEALAAQLKKDDNREEK